MKGNAQKTGIERLLVVVQIAAVGGSIGGRRGSGGAVYSGSLRLGNHPHNPTERH